MSAEWEKAVERFESEAAAILEEHGFPTNAAELLALDKDPPDHMVGAARLVIVSADLLRKEVARGKMSYALDKLFQVCSRYEEMVILKIAPEYRKTPLHRTHQFFSDIGRGLKTLLSAHNGGDARAIPTDTIEQWQEEANEVWRHDPNLSAREVATRIWKEGRKIETVRKKIKKPV